MVKKNQNAVINSHIVKKRIQEEIDECNKKFGKWEQIKKFELTPDVWSIENGHLTPTMKMKRSVILKKYSTLIVKIYNTN